MKVNMSRPVFIPAQYTSARDCNFAVVGYLGSKHVAMPLLLT
jgi:hypothetical protein